MGINAGRINAFIGSIYQLQLLILVRQEAIPAHAGIQLHMGTGLHAAALCHFVQAVCRLRGTNGGDGVCLYHLIGLIRHGSGAHDQNILLGVAQLPQPGRIPRLGDGKHPDAGLAEHLCHLLHTEAIAVCLEHGDDRHTGFFLNPAGIGRQLVFFYDEFLHPARVLYFCSGFASACLSSFCSPRWSPVRFFGLEVSSAAFFFRKRLRRRLR